MGRLKSLKENNVKWANKMLAEDPTFFERLSKQQKPEYLWIGCSDSRVPANEIVGLMPGELFVHRNIANVVVHTDFNCQSVIEYSVLVLKVKHIIVCGHYGCGGVKAAMDQCEHGLIDNWLRNIKDIYARNSVEIKKLEDPEQQVNRLCELNVKRQVKNVAYTHSVQRAWLSGQELSVHGWIYSIKDGLLQDLKTTKSSIDDLDDEYKLNLD